MSHVPIQIDMSLGITVQPWLVDSMYEKKRYGPTVLSCFNHLQNHYSLPIVLSASFPFIP